MPNLFKLHNPIRKYEWGSAEWIPELLGQPNPEGDSWAELWMGAHSAAPSLAVVGENELSLNQLIEGEREGMIGAKSAEEFGALPFLFKLLAAERPLSIQAHPNLDQAKEGWARENAAGIPLDARNRNYKDANHKPEILCALTPFRAMSGFRSRTEIVELLDLLDAPSLSRARAALDNVEEGVALKGFLTALFAMGADERIALGAFTTKRCELLEAEHPEKEVLWELTRKFAEMAPRDPAIISPLYLNVMDLQPGEAIYIPAGILHAYVHGFGVELMANSDNVLRGGLTPKHVDVDELVRTLRFEPFHPARLRGKAFGKSVSKFGAPCREFSLLEIKNAADLAPGAPYIVVIIDGVAILRDGTGEELGLSRGESAFVAARAKRPELSGEFSAYAATLGEATE